MGIAKDCIVIQRGGITKIVPPVAYENKFKDLGYVKLCTSEEWAEKINSKGKKRAPKKGDE